MENTVGEFGHSILSSYDLNMHNMEVSGDESGYITPPKSGFTSPLQDYVYQSAFPFYEQPMQSYPMSPNTPYLPPPYPSYDHMINGDPALNTASVFTADPESLESERDTPDSSIKEEPGEEYNQDETSVCRQIIIILIEKTIKKLTVIIRSHSNL